MTSRVVECLIALLVGTMVAGAEDAVVKMDTVNLTPGTAVLEGGNIYKVTGNITIGATAGKSALVARKSNKTNGQRVVIDIADGAALTVTGGDASGTDGGGAGIALPGDMTLYVTGKGRLIATGGNAAGGGNGSGGSDGTRQSTTHKIGAGGAGGAGGGGAGAGIGGTGGAGAGRSAPGNIASISSRVSSHGSGFCASGVAGGNGGSGNRGGACGQVFVLGDVRVQAKGGAAAAAGSTSWHTSGYSREIAKDNWFAGGGGGGGGGGAGGAAQSIGGGGGGGGAGGAGGSGTYVVEDDTDPGSGSVRGETGGQGGGGNVGGGGVRTDGRPAGRFSNYEESDSWTGAGGNGGAGGAQGDCGKLFALPTTGLSCAPYRASDGIAGLVQVSFLTVTFTLDLGLKDANGNAVKAELTQPFACRMVDIPETATGVNPRIRRAGYRFAGFWTEDGTCVYGPDYKPTMVLSPYTQNVTLFARWEVAPSILAVTSSGDAPSALDVYGNTAVTLRDAVEALVADPLLVGADGRRRVVFELAATDTVVRLTKEIEIPAGVRSFEINGLYGLETGVRIVAGANARHLHFAGKASDADGAFSLVSLTFAGGSPAKGAGGSVLIDGGASVAVDACSFLGNRVGKLYNGGAIGVDSKDAELLVTSTTFAGNSAYYGGAVHMDGAWSIFANSTFSANAVTGLGGGLFAGADATVGLLACTFADNQAKHGKSLAGANVRPSCVRAVNTIFGDASRTSESPVKLEGASALSADWCTLGGIDPVEVFANLGAPVTQVVAGVTHVVYPPHGGAASLNTDAAEIYHDASYAHLRAVGRDGRQVVLAGNPDLAKTPFVIDQFSAVRTTPTRGALRLAVGTEPVTVEMDGVLLDAAGKPSNNVAKVTGACTVFYDDGSQTSVPNFAFGTADGGLFGFSLPVDGSDGLAHNVTGIVVEALGPKPIEVATAPYALTAASVDLISDNNFIPLAGDAVAIGNVSARSISATNSFDALSAGSFTAGALRDFSSIDLEHVKVLGGSLRWLGGEGPAAGKTFANLKNMTVAGGVPAGKGEKTLTCNAGQRLDTDWLAEHDGFLQLQARCESAANGHQLGLTVREDGKDVLVVTPMGTVGPAGKGRRLIWTVPVRRGQTVRLTMSATGSAFSLSPFNAQFIYFGVKE